MSILGVGINDSKYVVSKKIGTRRKICPFYATWTRMLERCYSASFHQMYPTYIGCTVHPDWHRFSNFRRWMIKRDWVGKELDKDLMGNGKLYSKDTCVFITPQLNVFLRDSISTPRGVYPIGVTICGKRFRALIRVDGKQTSLGMYDTPEKAHQAWKDEKYKMALRFAEKEIDLQVMSGILKFAETLKL